MALLPLPGLDMNIAAELRARRRMPRRMPTALTPLSGLDMNIAAKLRAQRNPRIVPRRMVPPGLATGEVVGGQAHLGRRAPFGAAVDPLIEQANRTAFGFTNPLLQRLATARVAAEGNARKAYEAHAGNLEQGLQRTAAPIAQSFDTGIASAATINDAVAKRLAGQGVEAGNSLAAKLAQIGADQGAATELAKTYTGAGNAGFVKDSADLQHLVGRRSEAGSYQGKLPGIARLTANQDLQKALSQQGAEFASQENDLFSAAQEKAYQEYGALRQEQAQANQARQQAIENARELAAKDKMALRALRATAQTAAEKAMYASQEKALDRKLKADIAQLNADTKIATDNPPAAPKAPSLAWKNGAANKPWVVDPVTGKKEKNINYSGTWKGNKPVPAAGGAGKPRTTPMYAVNSVWNSVNAEYNADSFRWPTEIYNKIKGSPKAIDGVLNAHLENQMSAYNLDPTQSKRLKKSILKKLNGRKWRDNSGKIWTYKYGGK